MSSITSRLPIIAWSIFVIMSWYVLNTEYRIQLCNSSDASLREDGWQQEDHRYPCLLHLRVLGIRFWSGASSPKDFGLPTLPAQHTSAISLRLSVGRCQELLLPPTSSSCRPPSPHLLLVDCVKWVPWNLCVFALDRTITDWWYCAFPRARTGCGFWTPVCCCLLDLIAWFWSFVSSVCLKLSRFVGSG